MMPVALPTQNAALDPAVEPNMTRTIRVDSHPSPIIRAGIPFFRSTSNHSLTFSQRFEAN